MVDGTKTTDLSSGGVIVDVLCNADNGSGAETRRVPRDSFVSQVEALLPGAIEQGVETRTLSTPPVSPTAGARYLVGASATGAWAGKTNYIAKWSGTAWDFVAPVRGARVFIIDENLFFAYDAAQAQWMALGNPPILRGTRAELLLVINQPLNTSGYVLSDTGIATSTRSRASNVATVVLGSNHGIAENQIFTLSGLSDATMNGTWTAIAGTTGATIKFNNSGVDISSTADTGGKLVLNGGYNFNGSTWIFQGPLDSLNPVAGQIPIYTVASAPAASSRRGYLIYVTDEIGGATIAESDGVSWRRVSDRAIIASWIPSGVALYADFDANHFYWNGAVRQKSDLTDNGDGSFSLNSSFLTSTDITFIVEYTVDPDPTVSFSGTFFSLSNAGNQRIEVPVYDPGNDVNGQTRRLTRGYFSSPGNFVSPNYSTSIDITSQRGWGRRRVGFIVANSSAIISAVDKYPAITSSLTPTTFTAMTKFGFGRNIRFGNAPLTGATLHRVYVYDSALTTANFEATMAAANTTKKPVFFLGDSFLNLHTLTDEVRALTQSSYIPITQDGVGGSSISEQAVRFTGVSKVSAVSAATGSSVTLTVTNGGSNRSPAYFATGDSVTISGMVPTGYNGTYTLTGATNTSITFACTEAGALTTAGFATKQGITSRYWDDTLVIMDGGFDGDGYQAQIAISSMVSKLTHDRWLYVQSNPQVGYSSAGTTRADWETRDAMVRSFCGDRYVPTLGRMQSLMLPPPRDWAASTLYRVKDVVFDTTDNIAYRCIAEHTSSGALPIGTNADAAKWSILEWDAKIANWVASTYYPTNTIVRDTSANLYYKCATAHTASGSLPISTNTDAAKWQLVKTNWTSGYKYYSGDIVRDTTVAGYALYKCVNAHTASGSLPIATNSGSANWVRSYEYENVSDGLWPSSAMYDTIHPNVHYGNDHLAQLIYEALSAHGWV